MSGLLIGWGEIHPGCEERALRLFNEVVAYYGKKLEEGRLGGFEPFLLAAHGGGLRGFMIVRGTQEQITALSHEDEFRSYTIRAEMLMEDVGVTELFFGEELGHVMDRSPEALDLLAIRRYTASAGECPSPGRSTPGTESAAWAHSVEVEPLLAATAPSNARRFSHCQEESESDTRIGGEGSLAVMRPDRGLRRSALTRQRLFAVIRREVGAIDLRPA